MNYIVLKKQIFGKGTMLNINLNEQFDKGDFICVSGKSGVGKTSVLRMLAGLLDPDQGNVEINGNCWFNSEKKINIATNKRKIGFVFQDYGLFPNMTVLQNICFSPESENDPEYLDELMSITQIGELKKRKPKTLSGGQQQRVALVRALVRKADLLFLDEPLSALEEDMRKQLQGYIKEIHQRYQLTTIWVSHSENEIGRVAKRNWHLVDGRIVEKKP